MPTMLSTHAHYILLVVASLAAGALNAAAAGGSFISFPAMLGVGIPPVQANATNTVAIWPGQLTSVLKLRNDLRRELLIVAFIASILGGVAGALILLWLPPQIFLYILPWMISSATLLFLFSGRISRWMRKETSQPHVHRPISSLLLFPLLLPVCIYIGYFGAGGGLMVMALLALLGVDNMHQLNGMKVLVACLSNFSAVITFIVERAVVWHYCFIAMIAAGIGGYIGAHYARKLPQRAMRILVIIVGFSVSGYFFYRTLHPAH
ncbi:sulfite exporter TauE/SafE family protein [Terriglobus roseus]|uniref:Probable membrane transporter protein n=1 Tax=Terriglobus roseus TaxID=392734 RepID=A0A1G7QZQ1_9BACT|nr:sulfite exporter TauE/SafE family protein [Terriglobus roseus]SDG04001.1 hypothetical protein SAMN05444167_4066 [Terriglobus roseus]